MKDNLFHASLLVPDDYLQCSLVYTWTTLICLHLHMALFLCVHACLSKVPLYKDIHCIVFEFSLIISFELHYLCKDFPNEVTFYSNEGLGLQIF